MDSPTVGVVEGSAEGEEPGGRTCSTGEWSGTEAGGRGESSCSSTGGASLPPHHKVVVVVVVVAVLGGFL